jgi:hypothetical protein
MAMQVEVAECKRADHSDLDRLLDEALTMTFPASDPIAIYVERLIQTVTAVSTMRSRRAGSANT